MAGRDDLDRALDDDGPDDDLDVDDADGDGGLDDSDGGDGADWTPPTREEWEAHQAKLKRARDQAKRLREAAGGREGDRSRRPASRTSTSREGATRDAGRRADNRRTADEVDAELDRREAEATAREERERWEMRAVRGDARAALLARGASADLVDLAIAKIRPADIEYDDNDEPILDDWLDTMEERYPRLFRRRPATRGDGRSEQEERGAGRRSLSSTTRPGSLDQGAGSARADGDAGGGRRAGESYGAYMMRVAREADGLQPRSRRR